jgi:hydrogenase maturation protease
MAEEKSINVSRDRVVGILGVGNLLLSDEGFGVHFVEQLQHNYIIPENVRVLDGGTAGIMLAEFVEECDVLLVIDVVDLNDEPGSVHFFTNDDVKSGDIQTRMSPHQLGLLDIIEIGGLSGKTPECVEMLTVTPGNLETGMELTPELQAKIPVVTKLLHERLALLEIYLEAKS